MARRYRPAWEAEPQFSEIPTGVDSCLLVGGWLTNVEGDATKAFCKLCKCLLQAHKKDLSNHRACKKHQEALKFSQLGNSSKKLTTFFNKNITNERKVSELKIAAFIAEHCSILAADHLGVLISSLDKTSTVLSDLKLHRTKCAGLIKNVISPCMLEELLKDIGDSNFSAIIDESTSIDTKKTLCIMIRYFSKTTSKVETTFYRLLEIDAGDADTLVKAFKDQLIQDGLDVNKLIGIGIDGANVMVGEHHSFSSMLKETVPHLAVVKCVSHSLHLAAENACKVLPTHIEFIVKECHNWFANSTKRQIDYRLLYETLSGKKPLKLDKLSGTRWLARIEAVTKILDQWDALELHFRIAKDNERCYTASQLHLMLTSKPNKLYLLFLKQSLKAITDVNRMFQSDNVDSLKLLSELTGLLSNYLSILIPPERLQNVRQNDLATFAFRDYVMNISCIHFGYLFVEESANVQANDLYAIKERCTQCLIRLCEEIQKRIPSNIKLLEKVAVFSPQLATSQVRPDIEEIVVAFKDVVGGVDNVDATLQEWRILPFQQWQKTKTTDEFWTEVLSYKNACGEVAFFNLTKLATAILSLPFANAAVERAFSIMNIVKNKLRNRMHTKTAEHIMRVRSFLQNCGGCTNYEPTDKMIKLFSSENIYKTERDDEDTVDVLDFFNII